MLLLHIFIFKGRCLTWIEKMVFKMHYLSDSANFISVLTFLDHRNGKNAVKMPVGAHMQCPGARCVGWI